MILGPFLTDLDSRAGVKGSRDPLGIQPIWTRFGRHIVGNLTTQSNSVRDFTVLLLGYWFAEQVAETAGPGTELATFLKWEQLAGYARAAVNRDWRFRGTEQVRQRLEEGEVIISAEVRHQILSSQKLYGLWGLYSVPARSSALLDGEPARLTPSARGLVEKIHLPRLAKAGFGEGKKIVQLLKERRARLHPEGAERHLFAAVAGLLGPQLSDMERAFMRDHLLHGGPQDRTEGRQQRFAHLLEDRLAGSGIDWSPPAVRGLAKEAQLRGELWHPLARYLHRIATAEAVLAPAEDLYLHLLGCREMTVNDLARRVRASWGTRLSCVGIEEFGELEQELGGGDAAVGQRWLAIAAALSSGKYQDVIRLLLAQNRSVMEQRGGASAWAVEQNGRLLVRMDSESGDLPGEEQLSRLWRHSYFLGSLADVASQLKESGRG